MSHSFDEAKRLLGLLREYTDGEPCEIEVSEDRMGMVPDDEKYSIRLLTPTYELTPGILQALHRVGPFGVRHLGQVRENDTRHVWLLKPSEE